MTTTTTTGTVQINDRVTHATYGAGTIVDEHTFASGFSYSVRWDNGGPMSSSDCSWERPESLTRIAETHSAPSVDENVTILRLLRTHSMETVRGWSDAYEVLWLAKADGPRAAAWINFRVAYDDGLLSEWIAATAR